MPNHRYSHALVLSYYETIGFISLPHPPFTPPPASPSSTDFHLRVPSSSNDTHTPSVGAVPALSDSSTTSTASSLDDPVTRPLHSASSSIVTEIYAPQSQSADATSPVFDPAEDDLPDTLPSPPAYKNPPQQQSPPPLPKSRYSSFHDLSPFLQRHSSLSKSAKRPSRKRQRPQPEETPQPSRPQSPISHQPTQPTILSRTQPQQPEHHTPYKRLEPVLDTECLASLSLDDEAAHFPNVDVLPWKSPQTQSTLPPEYLPRGFSPTDSCTHYSRTQTTPSDPITIGTKTNRRTSSPPPLSPSDPPAPIKPFQISFLDSASPTPQHTLPPSIDLAMYMPPDEPPTHPLSHQASAESFDSVAPPPIRITPRHVPDSVSVQRRQSDRISFGGGGLRLSRAGSKAEGAKRLEMDRVRIRTKGR
ncbi:MAG: hypothetical protein Q9166_002140 [cf. Caloplaca sp. 2 TL-2023]